MAKKVLLKHPLGQLFPFEKDQADMLMSKPKNGGWTRPTKGEIAKHNKKHGTGTGTNKGNHQEPSETGNDKSSEGTPG